MGKFLVFKEFSGKTPLEHKLQNRTKDPIKERSLCNDSLRKSLDKKDSHSL